MLRVGAHRRRDSARHLLHPRKGRPRQEAPFRHLADKLDRRASQLRRQPCGRGGEAALDVKSDGVARPSPGGGGCAHEAEKQEEWIHGL